MALYGVQYTVTLADLTQSGFSNMQRSVNSVEASIASLNGTLRTTAAAFGIGMGLHGLIDMGKDLVQTYADYEQSLLRIKNVSKDIGDGVKNQQFIFNEAMKFKIPIEEATSAYGDFLTMIRGSHLASDEVRELHDNLLLIGKVTALPNQSMDAAVRNLGKLLEQGTLEGRHLRPLTYQLSGLAPYIAKELGMGMQQFEKSLSSGKLTKSATDSKRLMKAIANYAGDLKDKLPESLQSTQSALNDLHNAFFTMKMDLAQELKPEILSFIQGLKDGAHWLKEHKEQIITFGHTLVSLAKIWVGYKVALTAVTIAQNSYSAFMAGMMGNSARVITTVEAETLAYNGLAASIERVAYATELMAGASLSGNVGLGAMGIPLANAGLSSAGVATAGTGAAMGGMSVIGGALLVTLAFESILLLVDKFSAKGSGINGIKKGETEDDYYKRMSLRGHFEEQRTGSYNFVDILNKQGQKIAQDTVYQMQRVFVKDTLTNTQTAVNDSVSAKLRGLFPETFKTKKEEEEKKKGVNAKTLMNATDRIAGNRPVTYNVTIKEMNGVKDSTFEVQSLSKLDAEGFGRRMADMMLSVVNDSQIRQGN